MCLNLVRPRPPETANKTAGRTGLRVLALALALGLGVVEPALNPPAANAICFFWQACARQRGQASNTRAGGKRTSRIIGGNNASIPYVISPRNAWIREPGPEHPYTIVWNPVDGVNRYTVRIWRWTFERDQPDIALWETTVDNTNQLPFPQQVPLELGSYYSIEVVTDTGFSSDLDAGYYESGFQLLFEEDYEILRSQLTDVTPAPDTSFVDRDSLESATLARAGVFFLEEMYADALATLQPLVNSSTASDLVYTAVGDTYSQTGLNQLAINAYTQALTRAIAINDVLSEATIRVSLADVYATLGLFDQTLQQLQQARDAYNILAEETEIAQIDRRINIIVSRLSRQDEEDATP